jgi:hypothetical protein
MLRLAVGGLAAAFVFAVPSVARAQVSDQDSVTGTAATPLSCMSPGVCIGLRYVFDVHSGPSGENPGGAVSFGVDLCRSGGFSVTPCSTTPA